MRRLGLKPQPGSGNTYVRPQDGENGVYLAQLKSTEKQSISLKKADILLLCRDANVAHKVPIFLVDISGMVLVCVRAEQLDDFLTAQNARDSAIRGGVA